MLFRTISYFRFLLKSSNQHGIHSPFVYTFVTKGLYKKRVKTNTFDSYSQLKTLSKKEQKILTKIVNYFNINTIHFDASNLIKNSKNKYNLLFLDNLNGINIQSILKNSSNFFVLVHGIHQDKNAQLKWVEIIKNEEATVTINLFYFGLIFFRKEQEKEHFNIRA